MSFMMFLVTQDSLWDAPEPPLRGKAKTSPFNLYLLTCPGGSYHPTQLSYFDLQAISLDKHR